MFDRLTSLAHFFRMLVEPALNGLENLLMLPTRDPSLFAGGTAVLDEAAERFRRQGHPETSANVSRTSAFHPPEELALGWHRGLAPCVDGSELAREIFTSQGLVGAAMCSACWCGSHDRWP